ncbi:TlpA family protein disulfide reductase [Mucilaginibacter aquatilis]|uniref:Redoxin family protein n=1 Tax=Mucilaginibacter aquatilis TaxID=1517760 RepID=A0A6I4I3D4_9SPHI|nr:TlpA disulfide reductase family protein [Mucilaginibacter aquatilis]MVN89642.1 redoxin family protein [Mucilaginibacter aquatilis]
MVSQFKFLAALMLAVLCFTSMAQKPVAVKSEYAIIKGHVENHKENFWEFYQQGILRSMLVSVTIDKQGNFTKRIKVEGDAMDLLLMPVQRRIFVKKNDTINVNWDANKAAESFSITSLNKVRVRAFKKLSVIDSVFAQHLAQLRPVLYNKRLTDSAKFTALNDSYNEEIQMLVKDGVAEGYDKISTDIHFRYADLMINAKLLPRYELYINKPSKFTNFLLITTQRQAYATESEEWFNLSNEYRDFLFKYLVYFQPIKYTSTNTVAENSDNKLQQYKYAWRTYVTGLYSLSILEIRDWYCTQSIFWSFNNHPFDECVEVYKDFITKVKTPMYADTLKQFYQNVQRLKPGTPAPSFMLKDENGRMVSLSKFKGKVVYIDFWGVNCGPCISEIKNSVPALHERYKDKDIVFVNVCVDTDEKTWKASLKDLNLQGVNLIAPGWTKHPMVKAFNVTAIPHYFLIDANGVIKSNNCPSPGQSGLLYKLLDEAITK